MAVPNPRREKFENVCEIRATSIVCSVTCCAFIGITVVLAVKLPQIIRTMLSTCEHSVHSLALPRTLSFSPISVPVLINDNRFSWHAQPARQPSRERTDHSAHNICSAVTEKWFGIGITRWSGCAIYLTFPISCADADHHCRFSITVASHCWLLSPAFTRNGHWYMQKWKLI